MSNQSRNRSYSLVFNDKSSLSAPWADCKKWKYYGGLQGEEGVNHSAQIPAAGVETAQAITNNNRYRGITHEIGG